MNGSRLDLHWQWHYFALRDSLSKSTGIHSSCEINATVLCFCNGPDLLLLPNISIMQCTKAAQSWTMCDQLLQLPPTMCNPSTTVVTCSVQSTTTTSPKACDALKLHETSTCVQSTIAGEWLHQPSTFSNHAINKQWQVQSPTRHAAALVKMM